MKSDASITAVFADLVGSTSLGERLDPEELKLIVGDAVARVIDAVESFGGTIKDLAGDGVLALFGAPTAHEDDPERAVRASLRIVEEIADYAQEVEDAWGVGGFGVRVGVQTGPVVVGAIGAGGRVEYAALGDAVNTAARLQSAAGPGEVLVGEATMRLVEPMFDWGEPTELQLKGKSAPVVARVAHAATGVRAGMRGLEGVEARLIGRERELDEGRRAVAGALAGTGGILFVTGEPGIGKTRLVAELRDRFEAGTPQHGRSLWLEGRCVSYGETMPYWPFRDLLRSWIGVLADEPELRVRVALRRMAERLFGARAGELSPYLAALLGLTLEPDAAKRLAELSPEALQYRTFEVVREVIARLAEAGPLAVVLEDLHWSDATSLQLLERLFGDTEGTALLLVLTSRSGARSPVVAGEGGRGPPAPTPDHRRDAGGAVGRCRTRAAPRARGRGHAPRRRGAPHPRTRRGQSVLPGGADPVARGRRRGDARRGRLAVRPRRPARGPTDRREGHPGADRPARRRRARRPGGRVRARAAVRSAPPRGGGGRRGGCRSAVACWT